MATMLQPRLAPAPSDTPPPDVEALIEEARRRQRRRRRGIALAVVLLAATTIALYEGATRPSGSTSAGGTPGARQLCVTNQPGWRTRSVGMPGTAPALLLTNFRFGRVGYLNGHTDPQLRWRRGGILISVSDWTGSATSAMRSQFPPRGKLSIAARNFSSFEGVRSLGRAQVGLDGRLLEVWVQARPTTAATIAAANRELAGVRVCG